MGKKETVNLSECKVIKVTYLDKNTVAIKFMDQVFTVCSVAMEVIIGTEIKLGQTTSKLYVSVTYHQSGSFKLLDLRYPSKQFSLKTDEDKGAVVIHNYH